MNDYFDEAILKDEYLKILTKNNKTLTVKVISYDFRKLYYHLKGYEYRDNNKNSIFLKNICGVEFLDKNVQLSFLKFLLKFPANIDEYFNYYINCLEVTDVKNKGQYKRKVYRQMLDSLYTVEKDNLLVKYFGGIKDKISSINKSCILLNRSNNSQRIAINNAISNNISIIQGPPGTGKTTTILSLIANFIMDNKNVVVVSKNNSAVNNIIEELQKTDLPEFYLRFGSDDKVMDKLLVNINDKLKKLGKDLSNIDSSIEDLMKLNTLKSQLEIFDNEIGELMCLKNLIAELKTQKKFIDRKNNIYNFKKYINKSEARIICEKNANAKTINRLIKLSNKNKYNFFEKLLIRYKYLLRGEDLKVKINAISELLEQFYLNKEIVNKEEQLLQGRLEEKKKIAEKIYEEYILLCMNSFKFRLKDKMHIYSDKIESKKDLLKLAFNTYPLILTTADGFFFNFIDMIKGYRQIDCIIIDEASQCDVITGLPLLYLAKKIVVVGDSKQLSAITNINVDSNIPDCYKYENNSFLNSIKEVFDPVEKTLEEHYRCDYNIINFCNKYYYDNKLKIYTSASENAISIVNVDKYKGAEKFSKDIVNKREIKTINELVKTCDATFVITPFKGQAKLLEKDYGKDNAGTIHTFQGKGEDKVYFSTVFNDVDFCNTHIKSDYNMFTNELINVAVSRAKKKFILVGDKNYFLENGEYVPNVKNLIDYIGIYGNELFDNSSCIFDYLYKNIPYYQSTKYFDNEYEEKLFNSIVDIISECPYKCYCKLKLANLVQNEKFLDTNPDIKQYISNGSHADFTIFDIRINKPILVVELDGKYHSLDKQKLRDSYKDKSLLKSGIKVLRIPSKSAIDKSYLKKMLKEFIEI